MKNFKLLLLTFSLLVLSACNDTGGSSPAAKSAPVNSFLPEDPEGDDGSDIPEARTVTYYALSRTEAPINGWPLKTYTATGYCAEIDAQTFCWSDGNKTLQWTSNNVIYGPHRYNYWGLSSNINGTPQTCHGGCADDYMAAPVFVTNLLLQTLPAAEVQEVFDHGIAGTLNCTLTNGSLNCGSVVFQGF